MEENQPDEEGCQCGELWDREVVDIGEEDKTFVLVKNRAAPLDWVSLEVCSECGQHWLVGTDTLHNDVDCLLRLDAEAVERILVEDVWPADFDWFEALLEMARDAGKRVSYGTDSRASESIALEWCVRELAQEHPGIRVSRLASLLNIKTLVAKKIAERVAEKYGVVILFN